MKIQTKQKLSVVSMLIVSMLLLSANATLAQVDINNYELIWSDEFDEEGKPNSANWNYEHGFVRNHELQWYQAENAYCKNGLLIIEASKELRKNPNYNLQSEDWRKQREYIEYSSACLITAGKQEWEAGGYYEIRARINTASGSWPAIWLLGNKGEWPDNGEIDIMEFYQLNNVPHILANAAWGTSKRYTPAWDSEKIPYSNFVEKDANWGDKFHVWAMDWSEDFMDIYLDGELLNRIDLNKTKNANGRNPFKDDQKFYLLLNLAIGSNGGIPDESAFPMKYEIDYVRVYKSN